MLANHILLKIVLAPMIIAAATLIARRWGENIGGMVIGLPLTSGPVSVFFALEQGRSFAAHAALGAILGLIPVAVFGIGYVQSAKHFRSWLPAVFGILAYLAAVWAISNYSPSMWILALLVAASLTTALLLIGKPEAGALQVASPWWDLPLRMLVATALLLLITGAAGILGSKWSGLLSPFPVFTFVMATFSLSQGGTPAAWRLVRGVLSGLFSYLSFFIVVTLLIEHASLWVVYPLATCVALGVNATSLLFLSQRNHIIETEKVKIDG